MNAAAPATNSSQTGWWRRVLRSLGAVAGSVAVAGASASGASAQDAAYRAAATAPMSWQAFAGQLQSRFEGRLAADDEDARAFHDYLAKREGAPNARPLTFVARTWILPDGKVERLEFDGLDDKEIAVHLRALLTRDSVRAPPPDMLQPLRLRLSLRSKEQPVGRK